MKILVIALIILLSVMSSGCIDSNEEINTQTDAQNEIDSIGQDISNVKATLDEIDEELG